jgi:hypothetical protein
MTAVRSAAVARTSDPSASRVALSPIKGVHYVFHGLLAQRLEANLEHWLLAVSPMMIATARSAELVAAIV